MRASEAAALARQGPAEHVLKPALELVMASIRTAAEHGHTSCFEYDVAWSLMPAVKAHLETLGYRVTMREPSRYLGPCLTISWHGS